MIKRSVLFLCLLACILGVKAANAQVVFYSNTIDDNNYFPAGYEVAMPVVFSGSYEVDNFSFGYFLPENSLNGATTDAIIRFYTPGESGGAFDGTLVSATRQSGLVSAPNGSTTVVFTDLTPFGDFFQWDAGLLPTGETGGWVSIEFTNPDAGWELARGDSTSDYFQDMTNGDYLNFGGSPQAAFNIEIAGQQIPGVAAPEPGTLPTFLIGFLMLAGILLLSRRNRRSAAAINSQTALGSTEVIL